jgi:hypothetical protein
LFEEEFFYWYYYHCPPWETRRLPVFERKWFLDRFVQQKEKENEEMEKARKKK